MTVVYDAGALVAAERSNRQLWADHRARLELGRVPLITAPAVAQLSRSAQQVSCAGSYGAARSYRSLRLTPMRSAHWQEPPGWPT